VKSLVKLIFCLALFFVPIQFGFSRGDKVIPQIVDGPGWITKFDLTNVSTNTAGNIAGTFRLAFFHNDGTPWTLQVKDFGAANSFSLTIGARQTLRIETLGTTQPVTGGYAIIYDEEPQNSAFSEDFVLGISVFYVVLNGSSVADTVTVTVAQPTAVAKMPVEMNDGQGTYSGLAIVNRSGASNPIRVDLYSSNWVGGPPDNPPDYTATFNLASNEQKAMFFDNASNPTLFPNLKSFKGMAEITAIGPFALLGLLQTRAGDFTPRYSTLVPVDMESLRRNSYMALLQADIPLPNMTNGYIMPLDLDNMVSDFYRVTGNPDGYSWDLEYRYDAPDTTSRYLQAFNGAAIVSLGTYDAAGFDAISLPTLKAVSYTANNIVNLSLNPDNDLLRTFAVRTDLGNYAKFRIFRTVNTTINSQPYVDLVLEVVIYR
jgi:hypothetical protein